MEQNIGLHAYLALSAQQHCVSLGPPRTRQQGRTKCARHLSGETSVRENGNRSGQGWESQQTAVPVWSLVSCWWGSDRGGEGRAGGSKACGSRKCPIVLEKFWQGPLGTSSQSWPAKETTSPKNGEWPSLSVPLSHWLGEQPVRNMASKPT